MSRFFKRSNKTSIMSKERITVHRDLTKKVQRSLTRAYSNGEFLNLLPGSLLYHRRYVVLGLVGFGATSTVWVAQDKESGSLVVVKALATFLLQDNSCHEVDMLTTAQKGDSSMRGYDHVCRMLQHFRLRDIKGDNIFVAGEPLAYDRSRTFSRNDLQTCMFTLGDLGSAQALSDDDRSRRIQPRALRSPEVILGAAYDTKVDIWNLGCLVYEFATGEMLFDPPAEGNLVHLAQIENLLGSFPSSLLARSEDTLKYFDAEGRVRRAASNPTQISNRLKRSKLPPSEIYEFTDFLELALTIDPTTRPSATTLLSHSWLDGVQ
ncbi:hypothetical protein EIP91_005328 [Steccherinum ochraceum]|uniref:non-specific serine/threonine protein kinase n=1 Tax=Steccherinum ochraceum TaxID=92696 RepID=A0A4V2MVQ7_9APHY|nr:hypothetical protein EIP91_005328 [Steccherinum ochraceum]